MIIHGKDIIIKADGEVIAAAKSCELDISAEVIKTASPTDGQWQHGIAGRKSWRATCSHLVTDILNPAQMVGEDVTLTFHTMSDVTFYGITNNPTLATGTPPTTGYVVWDAIRKDFLWKHVPAPGVDVYFQNFSWKPALVVGNYYYNNVTSKTYTWTGSDLSEVSALTGPAIVKEWKLTASRGNLAQGSFRFEGVGPLE